MYKSEAPSQLTASTVRQALVRLADLLATKNLRLELVCCGGVVSVLYHASRQMTHDVDVLFPDDPRLVSVLTQLVDQVGAEMRLEHGPRDRWLLEEIADPQDTDPLRYALKACVLERMAEIWSSPPKNVQSSAPPWCERVPAAPVQFSVVSPEYEEVWREEEASPVFAKRNIFAPRQFMFFV